MGDIDSEVKIALESLRSDPRFGLRNQYDNAVDRFNWFCKLDSTTNLLAWIIVGLMATCLVALTVRAWQLDLADKVRLAVALGIATLATWFEITWTGCGF